MEDSCGASSSLAWSSLTLEPKNAEAQHRAEETYPRVQNFLLGRVVPAALKSQDDDP